MVPSGSLVLYKGKRAHVKDSGDKITITLQDAKELKVREKDVILLHGGPLRSLNALTDESADAQNAQLFWELMTDGGATGNAAFTLREMAETIWNEWTPETAWDAYLLLRDGLYFQGEPDAIRLRSAADVDASLKNRADKAREQTLREGFLERLKARKLELPADSVFLRDVEALALGRTDKSKTMRETGMGETAPDAHKLLLSLGVWDAYVNPYPEREGLVLKTAKAPTPPPPTEERRDLSGLGAYAIDNEDSADPDDALSVEAADGGLYTLYAHIADPAAGIAPGSEADVEARGRGATLYLPEGVYRMLNDSAVEYYALGLCEKSAALTFKITFSEEEGIVDTDIFPSLVAVKRLTYKAADAILAGEGGGVFQRQEEIETCGKMLAALKHIAQRNVERRLKAGASIIEFPEAHICVKDKEVSIEAACPFQSSVIVRECMLLAGEGAAQWAITRRLPFPFVSQETGDVPKDIAGSLAGAYQLRRCMRPRLLSAKPSLHWGLGLDVYTQVTSPLRRYTDLLCHEQIRAALAGRAALNEDELLCRLAVSERGAAAAARAARDSCAHWTRVYLSDKIGSVWDAVVLDRKGNSAALVFIPDIALETQITLHGEAVKIKPNDAVQVKISSVKIAEGIINAVIAA